MINIWFVFVLCALDDLLVCRIQLFAFQRGELMVTDDAIYMMKVSVTKMSLFSIFQTLVSYSTANFQAILI